LVDWLTGLIVEKTCRKSAAKLPEKSRKSMALLFAPIFITPKNFLNQKKLILPLAFWHE
jgi:hypothetical protein